MLLPLPKRNGALQRNIIMNPYQTEKSKTCHQADNHLSADDSYLYAASSGDMTGLTPTVAHNEAEAQNYEEVYPYLPPVPPAGATAVPEISPAEGIHAEYRTKVTKQSKC